MSVASSSIMAMSMLASSIAPAGRSMGTVSDRVVWLTAVPQSGARRRSSSWLISEISSKISRTWA
jgi:hypothetical protein